MLVLAKSLDLNEEKKSIIFNYFEKRVNPMSINKLSNDLVEATKKVLTRRREYKDFFQKVMKKFGVKSRERIVERQKKKNSQLH